MRKRATIDYETRSAADIRNGPYAYAKHPTTRIMCLSFVLPGWDPDDPSNWSPVPEDCYYGRDGSQTLDKLFAWIESGGLVEGHNVMFERAITEHLASKPMGLDPEHPWVATGMSMPVPRDTQWRCSAAKCAAYALPRALGQAGEALRMIKVKDEEGGRLMKLLAKPRRALKNEPLVNDSGVPIIYWRRYEHSEYERLYTYCQDDVTAEHYISEVVPDLTESEYQVWLADFRANWRGVMVDEELVDAAIAMDRQVKQEMNEELTALTGIGKGTERAAISAWVKAHGLQLQDTTAATLDWVMVQKEFKDRAEDDPVKRVVSIARNINRTSITKYLRVKACMDPIDKRVRDLVMYHGAATGRWSGKGIQVQNFPRGIIGDITGLKPYHPTKNPGGWSMAQLVEDIKSGNIEWCRAVYGDLLAMLSSALRGVLIPAHGLQFYVADYSAIEARVVLWVAGADEALEVFYRGDDIYCDMASSIYGRPITKKDKDERQFGKVVILGLGYGMGFLTFLLSMRGYDLKFEPAKALEILGTDATKYVDWVKEWLWPVDQTAITVVGETPKEKEKRIKTYKSALARSKKDLHRLRDKRETPENIIEELALCKFVVDAYRARYPEVKQLWTDQEAAACRAVELYEQERDRVYELDGLGELELKPVRCGKVTWCVEDGKLLCWLPGRKRALVYNSPYLKYSLTPWGKSKPELRFMGVGKKSKKWTDMGTYGGSIVENIVQATARDMMAISLVKVSQMYYETHEAKYEPITTIHDELLAEAPLGYGDVEQFEHLLTDLPAEYTGCPVAAEGARLNRYQK